MSDQPTGMPGGQPGEPSEEEVRAYLTQLRGAPAEQVVAEVASALLNAAQVKLGRQDARLLLDLAASVVDGARAQMPEQFTSQVDDVLAQLRLAQVDAEREVASARQQGHEEPNDVGGAPAPPETTPGDAAPQPPPTPRQPPPSSSPGGGLWVPGR